MAAEEIDRNVDDGSASHPDWIDPISDSISGPYTNPYAQEIVF
jgi:hypothetical protein